jgi:hypothetical protein
MTRKQYVAIGGIAAAAVIAFMLLIGFNSKEAAKRLTPAWLDPQQPAGGIAPDLLTVSEGESWAANRCRPMVASCGDNTAGRRIRRTYPGTLVDCESSLIRGRLAVELGGGI